MNANKYVIFIDFFAFLYTCTCLNGRSGERPRLFTVGGYPGGGNHWHELEVNALFTMGLKSPKIY
jgi:hypothetical protein